jgi:hypothetical protein
MESLAAGNLWVGQTHRLDLTHASLSRVRASAIANFASRSSLQTLAIHNRR